MPTKQARLPLAEAHQTVRLNIDTNHGSSSIRIGFTDQRLTAHGGMIVWSHFLHPQQFRRLKIRYKRNAEVHLAFLELRCALLCWRFL